MAQIIAKPAPKPRQAAVISAGPWLAAQEPSLPARSPSGIGALRGYSPGQTADSPYEALIVHAAAAMASGCGKGVIL